MRLIKRCNEKAITAYYRNEVKDITDDVYDSISSGDLSQENKDWLSRYGVAIVTKLLQVGKSEIQIKFYIIDLDQLASSGEMGLMAMARKFGRETMRDIEALLQPEAFFVPSLNYISCKVPVTKTGSGYTVDKITKSGLFSTVLHEFTHYLDKMTAGDYHNKNYVNPNDSEDFSGFRIVEEFEYLLYAIWNSTERNAFQTSDQKEWETLENQVESTTSQLYDILDSSNYMEELLFDHLKEIFIRKTKKSYTKSSKSFIKWWCDKTRDYMKEMNKKRSKDLYLAKSSDEEIQTLSNSLYDALMPVLGKSSVKIEVPFNFYSVRTRTPYKDKLTLTLSGFMDELDSGSVKLTKSNLKLGLRDLPILHKIFDAVSRSDRKFLKKYVLSLAGDVYRETVKVK